MADKKDKQNPAPLAYQNEQFLDSPDGRILRILAEYQEPLVRFRREQIQDTVVFFGSARFQGQVAAKKNLTVAEKTSAKATAEGQGLALKQAQAAFDMARYYEDARRLALDRRRGMALAAANQLLATRRQSRAARRVRAGRRHKHLSRAPVSRLPGVAAIHSRRPRDDDPRRPGPRRGKWRGVSISAG